jgi:two-component system nitrate/nitrite response regulator NarL
LTRIVIADDHKFFRSGLEAAILAAGMTIVASVGDGEAALKAIADHDPDVVILDLKMPGRDGVSTLETMRAAGDNRPVVVLAAEIEDDALVAIIKVGVNAIVSKAGGEMQLFDAIKAIKHGTCIIDRELLDRAFALAKEGTDKSVLDKLSPRERELVNEIARGHRNKDIAETFNVAEGTVKVYLNKIYAKLGVSNRTELAILALDKGEKPRKA